MDQSLEEVFASAFERIRQDGWVAHSEFYSSLDSTNDFLKRAAEADSDASLPRLVVAQHQTAGRGRGQNRWWSPTGVLTFSVLVSNRLHEGIHDRLPQLSLVTAIAVANAMDNILSVPSQLKWPNDVYVHDRKICGILVESILRQKSLRTVIGIGINVDVDLSFAPDDIRAKATSMHLHATTRPALDEVLVQTIQQLANSMKHWQADQSYLAANFQSRCYLQNKLVEIDSNGMTIRGLCGGINENGELLVQDESGRPKVIRAGVIRLIQSS